MSDDTSSFDDRPQTAGSMIDEASLSQFTNIKLKLSPLLHLEDVLIQRLSSAEEDEATHLGPWNGAGSNKEVFVRSGAPWKKALGKLAKSPKIGSSAPKDPDDPVHILNACKVGRLNYRDLRGGEYDFRTILSRFGQILVYKRCCANEN